MCLTAIAVCLLATGLPLSVLGAENTDPAQLFSTITNSSSNEVQEAKQALQNLEEQLHSATLALEQARRDSEAAARRGAEALAERLAVIEKTLGSQAEREQNLVQKSNRMVLIISASFAAVGILMMLLSVWFQVRALNRLAEMAALRREIPALALQRSSLVGPDELSGTGLNAAEVSSQRLLSAVASLEKRLHQIEHTAALPPTSGGSPPTNQESSRETNPPAPEAPASAQPTLTVLGSATHKAERINLLLGKGQSLLSTGQVEKALECFDEAVALDPHHAEALMKKGTVLEKQEKFDEALDYYDRAIAANRSLTLAYLYKGGVFNQLERFDEALECYEQALHAQQVAGNSDAAGAKA